MKNLKIYKSALALMMTGTITLFSGCSSNNPTKEENNEGLCKHVTIFFEDQSITIKDCEDYGEYDVSTNLFTNARLTYSVKKDEKTIISGVTSAYNIYEIDHEKEVEIFNNETPQKAK